jgi:hypothetical protein
MTLYNIDENDVIETMELTANECGDYGKQEILNEDLIYKYGYPLKVVFIKENEDYVIISAYPLIKGKKK